MCRFLLRNRRRIPVFLVCREKMTRSEIHRPPLWIQIRNSFLSPPRALPLVTSSSEHPTLVLLPPRPNLLYTLHSVVTPLTCSRATPSVDQTWHSTWTTQEVGIASCSFLTSGFALRLHARSVFTRLKPPAAPRSMNVATESSTPPLSSLNPNTVAPKPIH